MQASTATMPSSIPTAEAGANTAAPSPQYNPPPTPQPPPQPMMEEGGAVSSGGGGFRDFFSDINILDVVISAFIVGGVLYAVHYYKFMMLMEKTGYADLNSRVQKLETTVSAAKKASEVNATGNRTKGFPVRKRPAFTL